jgi:hypothetical protein
MVEALIVTRGANGSVIYASGREIRFRPRGPNPSSTRLVAATRTGRVSCSAS